MAYENIEIASSDEALTLAKEALAMPTLSAELRWRTICWLIDAELLNKNVGVPVKFTVSARALLFSEFFDAWVWFRKFGIQPEDYLDVVERARPLVRQILLNPLAAELTSLEGFTEFMVFARQRFDAISHSAKYKAGWNDDPHGQ